MIARTCIDGRDTVAKVPGSPKNSQDSLSGLDQTNQAFQVHSKAQPIPCPHHMGTRSQLPTVGGYDVSSIQVCGNTSAILGAYGARDTSVR